jgi:glycosyltransferase involved in cell wall biosynthesis
LPEIIQTRSSVLIKPAIQLAMAHGFDYLLIVCTIEPRKNHLGLLAAWEALRTERFPNLKLLVVGKRGWHHNLIVKRFRPWMDRGEAFLLEDVPFADLRLLYKHARATVCPSFGEGFDFSGVEAMKSGGTVVASDIPAHREVYVDAAEYCNPYSTADIVRAIVKVIDPSQTARRDELVSKGADIARRYEYQTILPQWQAFLSSMR